MNRLVDVLLIHVLRAWLRTGPAKTQPASWLCALDDLIDVVARSVGHTSEHAFCRALPPGRYRTQSRTIVR